MQVVQGIRPDILPASVVTLGMFDGVHRGHQALLHGCRLHAGRLGVPAVALTYEPHPSRILRPDQPLRLLTLLAEKLERLSHYAMDEVVIADFTLAFSQLTAEQFVAEVLLPAFHPQVIVTGYRTTFGRGRGGNAMVLRELGGQLGFDVQIVEPILIAGEPVSSTRIRHCLDEGDVDLAAELLGYPYRLTGVVMRGDGRGHTIGVPTANLEVPPDKLIPADGVYMVEAFAGGLARRGVMNVGCRPTFNRPRSLEVHLLDFDGDLYAQPLTVEFITRLRDVQTFPHVQALLAQIQEDIRCAREYTRPS
ncbi:MAG: bifunctional riboflavin kinase/FAD synthetase [Armatimonadota bacterium]